jgi:hypothetical protein
MVEGRQTEIQSSLIIDLRCSPRLLRLAVRFLFSDPGSLDVPITNKAARRKFAALQNVILNERLAGSEGPKSAKPTLQPSACVLQPDPHRA